MFKILLVVLFVVSSVMLGSSESQSPPPGGSETVVTYYVSRDGDGYALIEQFLVGGEYIEEQTIAEGSLSDMANLAEDKIKANCHEVYCP